MTNDQTVEKALLPVFYQEICTEIARLRDFEWTIGYYFSSIAGALIFFANDKNFSSLISAWVSFLLCVFQLISMGFVLYYLAKYHGYLTNARRIRNGLEALFGLDKIRDSRGDKLIPDAWQGPRVSFEFQFGSVVLPIMFAVVGIQGFSVYMVGKPFFTWFSHCSVR